MAGLRHLWPRCGSIEARRKQEMDGRYPASSCGPRARAIRCARGAFLFVCMNKAYQLLAGLSRLTQA